MGYQILQVTNGLDQAGQGGQGTVITYRPEREAQAKALARRLPGPKVLSRAEGALPADAMVIIR
jgi:hypothetical protein